jgi:hypothetical protein
MPAVKHVRWWLVLLLSFLFGAGSTVAAFLTVNASMDAVSNEQGELRISVIGICLHQERGPWQPLEKKMFSYGWALVGGYVVVGVILGTGIGVSLPSRVNSNQDTAVEPLL